MPERTFYDVLSALAAGAQSMAEKGGQFERLVKAFLEQDKNQSQRFSRVWRWADWPGNGGLPDTGIDLVAEERETGALTAIQCKFYLPSNAISREEVNKFLTDCGTRPFAGGIFVSTSDRWTGNAEAALCDRDKPVQRWGPEVFEQSSIDWSTFTLERPEELVRREPKTPREHQKEALAAVLKGFEDHDRGKLIMACGTGKTYTALQIAEQQVAAGGVILFLAPSLTLISQSIREWGNDATVPMRFHAVCSDTKVATATGNSDSNESAPYDLISPATTSAEQLVSKVTASHSDRHRTVIFSTYQSLDVLIAAQQQGLARIDLVICDEAHRTTGVTLADADESEFTKVHDNGNIQADKRLYMTATPRIFHPDSKARARDAQATLASMDDERVYGPEFYRMSFADAVEQKLLCDYRVLIFGVSENAVARHVQSILSADDGTMSLNDAAKIVASWNAIAKQKSPFEDFGDDPEPMRRVVAFANRIDQSQQFTGAFNATVEEYTASKAIETGLSYVSEHVDGRQNALMRANKLEWLRQGGQTAECHILSNARCLTEGVDVPALDAVLFLSPRSSQIDVVQAVGRAMRIAEGKKYGYIIIPIAVNPESNYTQALRESRYRVTWQVLQALKSHDEDFYDAVNQSDLKSGKKVKVVIFPDDDAPESRPEPVPAPGVQFPLPVLDADEIRDAVYARIVDSLTDRHYYKRWAQDVSRINEQYQCRINGLLDTDNPELQREFDDFLKSLQRDLNSDITRQHAVSMLAQHLITKPIFDALFAEYSFTAANPVSQAMERMAQRLELEHGTASETQELEGFYKSVQRRIRYVEKAADKQRIIADLYEDFFKEALPKEAASLGIVYTPVEAVDYILRSVEDLLQAEFGVSFSSAGVHILDPFAGTGTFIQRLLTSGLVQPHDLARKYTQELHANEFILLAYYIAAINIETTYHELAAAQQYTPFAGIVLADTFESAEFHDAPQLSADFTRNNNVRMLNQQKQDIRVIMGNPPWSIGQSSENDANKNRVYPHLRQRISDTYAKKSIARSQQSLYDTYVQAIRWASDQVRKSDKGGVVAFVTNGGFISSYSADGLRKTLVKEFHAVYCLDLRGDARTSGERRRREGGGVFDYGSRASAAILLLVKKPGESPGATIYYRDIGDYRSRERKLAILDGSRLAGTDWQVIAPNEYGDWINQRTAGFSRLFPLYGEGGIFTLNSLGIKTNRDAWLCNFSKSKVAEKTESMMEFFNSQIPTDNPDLDPTKFSWTDSTLAMARKGIQLRHDPSRIIPSVYRVFCRQNTYFDRSVVERVYQQEHIYPRAGVDNIGIVVSEKDKSQLLSCLMTDILPNLSTLGTTSKYLPRYRFTISGNGGSMRQLDEAVELERVSNISPDALAKFREHYAEGALSEDDLFYYVYGVLHHPGYRTTFEDDLKLEPARIPLAATLADFRAFAQAGRDLADLHINYETVEPYPLAETHIVDWDAAAPAAYRVTKMSYGGTARNLDKTVLRYNAGLTLSGLPEKAQQYRLGSRSALDWLIDRYQVKTDRASGIVNDPNAWAAETGNPRYILDLVKRVTTVSVKTVDIVAGLPALPGLAEPETAPSQAAFERLADEWERERPRGVDVAEMTAHPAYQSIIAMGEAAVSWILERLAAKPDHWFVALNAITGAAPVPPESRGRVKEMAAAWLEWGRQQGYGV